MRLENIIIHNNKNINDFMIKVINKYYIFNIDSLTDSYFINEFILLPLKSNKDILKLPNINIKEIDIKIVNYYLYNGFVIIIKKDKIYAIECKLIPKGDTISNEKSIKGSKESFTDNILTNMGLMRKRIRSKDLKNKEILIGTSTHTKIYICYMSNIVNKKLVSKVYKKLININIDSILNSSSLISSFKGTNSTFPSAISTERPDNACFSVLEGKIVILVDNSKDVLIIPTFFMDLFHNPDDYYNKRSSVNFIRILRLISFFLAIFLPAYYISITTFNIDSIPTKLLVDLMIQRSSVPFPSIVEALIMIISFEILRESDLRMPSYMGSSVSILGGLILGSAAVSAGIISPIMIIVIAISSISGLIFTNLELINAIRGYRLLLLILSSFLGIYGMFIGLMILLIDLSKVFSFNKNYLFPLSPINYYELKDSFIKLKRNPLKRNPLLTKNIIRGAK
ncbi:MAG: spore germination protein [Bacilli bacterium]